MTAWTRITFGSTIPCTERAHPLCLPSLSLSPLSLSLCLCLSVSLCCLSVTGSEELFLLLPFSTVNISAQRRSGPGRTRISLPLPLSLYFPPPPPPTPHDRPTPRWQRPESGLRDAVAPVAMLAIVGSLCLTPHTPAGCRARGRGARRDLISSD